MNEHCMEEINLLNDALKQKSEEIERKARELEESYRDIKAISVFGQRITNLPDVEKVLGAIHECVAALIEADIFAAGLMMSRWASLITGSS